MNNQQQINKFLKLSIDRIKKSYDQPEIEELKPNQSLVQDLGFDSLQIAELSVILEAEYGIDVFRNGIVDHVETLTQVIEGHLNHKA